MILTWYWWLLIGIVVLTGGYFKLKLLKKLMNKKSTEIDE